MIDYDELEERASATERALVWIGCLVFCAGFWLLAGPVMWAAVQAAWRVIQCPPVVCG